MMKIFGDLDFIKIYIDDFLIFSKSIEEHESHLNRVFQRLINNNIKINLDKSSFYSEEVKFLGSIITNKGIKPNIQKILKIAPIKEIKSRKKLLKILGIIQWFRPFIKNLSNKISPLTSMTSAKIKFKIDEKDVELINVILKEIETQTLLNLTNLNKEFTLYTDASNFAIGSTLTQNGKVIAFFSSKLSDVETRYSIVDKEFYSIYKSLIHFRQIILGQKIKVFTDNRNVTYFKKHNNNMIFRWLSDLDEFYYEVKNISGSENQFSDYLSRINLIVKIPINKLQSLMMTL
ncbi:Retrovirus-related Pol polyprotein from transposon 17.6 [Dictyocoela muelleri]|nr:Retrovirus-related Pol polyprotein from transposon 17.6 [Dictyocoela muelleri]